MKYRQAADFDGGRHRAINVLLPGGSHGTDSTSPIPEEFKCGAKSATDTILFTDFLFLNTTPNCFLVVIPVVLRSCVTSRIYPRI